MRPRLLDIELHRDARGALLALQSGANLPFTLQRVFFISEVPPGKSRAEHVAGCQQVLVALQGSCEVLTAQAGEEQAFRLASPAQALYVPEGVWLKLHRFSPGTLLAVAADRPYSPR